jgi:hypothetical protein
MGSLLGRLQARESGLGNPVFAIAITDEAAPSSPPFDGRRVSSCSQACLAWFLDQPAGPAAVMRPAGL